MSFKTLTAAAVMSMMLAGAAHAATEKFTAKIDGPDENPKTDSKGMGTVTATLDTVTMAHFHGPALPGANAGPVVPVPAADIMATKIHGTATLTDAQIADLTAGKWYFNIHTAAHPGGEVRGQVMMAK
jgi:hypothetical protein